MDVFTLVALVAPAFAADWADPWRGSRWLMEMEETTPQPVSLSAEANRSFRTRGIQVSAIVSCPELTPFGKGAGELDCTFESLALRATPRSPDAGEALADQNGRVLDDAVARLKSTRVRIGLSSDGRVTSMDLPDLKGGTRWESESRETLRRVAADLFAGWSLKRPETWDSGWVEKSSGLLRAPSQPSSMGLSKTTHTVSLVEGTRVVHGEGEGSFTSPFVPYQFAFDGKIAHQAGAKGGPTTGTDAMGGGKAVTGGSADYSGRYTDNVAASATTPSDMTFSGVLSSVVVVDDAGAMQERVYTMIARPTASSIGNMQGASVWWAGHVRRLSADEAPPVGDTAIVAPPGVPIEGLATWVPLETL